LVVVAGLGGGTVDSGAGATDGDESTLLGKIGLIKN